MLEVTDFQKDVVDSDIPVFVDFHAKWCQPCKALKPHLDAMEPQFEGRVKFVSLNIEDHDEIVKAFGIRGIPTLLLFKNPPVPTLTNRTLADKEIFQIAAGPTPRAIIDKIESHLS